MPCGASGVQRCRWITWHTGSLSPFFFFFFALGFQASSCIVPVSPLASHRPCLDLMINRALHATLYFYTCRTSKKGNLQADPLPKSRSHGRRTTSRRWSQHAHARLRVPDGQLAQHCDAEAQSPRCSQLLDNGDRARDQTATATQRARARNRSKRPIG